VTQAGPRLFPQAVTIEATYFFYYALGFFVLRWWRMTSRRRSVRFSFLPLLGAGFWAAVLWLLLRPQHLTEGRGIIVLLVTATVVQLVSPWEEPPPVPARRVRFRHA